MNINFPALLVILALVSGVVWALDVWWWKPRRQKVLQAKLAGGGVTLDPPALQRTLTDPVAMTQLVARTGGKVTEQDLHKAGKEPVWVEYARTFFPIILIVLLLRSFLIEPFRIPSGSMIPTLLVGDFILVNKYTYGLRLPVLNKKIVAFNEPQRGDVVVFRYPRDPSLDYIKRVIGLPGDRVRYSNRVLYINGVQMPQTVLDGADLAEFAGTDAHFQQRREHLDQVVHTIQVAPAAPSVDQEVVVPAGHYFVMGDNRDNSNDSRAWGYVPEENLVGKAFLVWMSWDSDQGGVAWRRIGQSIH